MLWGIPELAVLTASLACGCFLWHHIIQTYNVQLCFTRTLDLKWDLLRNGDSQCIGCDHATLSVVWHPPPLLSPVMMILMGFAMQVIYSSQRHLLTVAVVCSGTEGVVVPIVLNVQSSCSP